MKVDTRPRHKNAGRPAEKDARGFLQWLRGRECVWAGRWLPCDGKIVPQHLDFAGGKGTSTKVADKYCLPSCDAHHGMQHDKGWDTFLDRMGVTKEKAVAASAKFWGDWPGRIAWERKLKG